MGKFLSYTRKISNYPCQSLWGSDIFLCFLWKFSTCRIHRIGFCNSTVFHTALQWRMHNVKRSELKKHFRILRRYPNFSDVIMREMASQITAVSIVCSTVCSGADIKIEAPCHWPLWGHRWSGHVIHGFLLQRVSNADMFPFDDVIMPYVALTASPGWVVCCEYLWEKIFSLKVLTLYFVPRKENS